MGKMKGDYLKFESIYNNVLYAAGVAFLLIVIIANVAFGGGVRTPLDELNAIESAHAIEYCFTTLGDNRYYITRDFLDTNDKKSIKDICGIIEPKIEVEVLDFQSNKKWVFDKSLKDYDHMIYISIEHEGNVYPGGLYVKI